jgi:hypothetical protein
MAKTITVSIPHDLGAAEARRRLETGLSQLGSQVPGGLTDLKQSWSGDTLAFSAAVMGQRIAGTLEVQAAAVKMDLDLPGLLGMIAGKIKGALTTEGQKLLTKR